MDDKETKKSLRYAVYDGAAFAVMDGMTASFLTPFAVALNASVGLIAAITYVPRFVGALVQLFVAGISHLLRDRKKILVTAALLHAALWIPLLLIPYLTPNQKYLLVVYISIQSFFAELMQPIWSAWLGDIVPKHERGRFFGFRNKIIGATSFIAALAAGLLLNYLSPTNPFLGFSILFSIAFIARVISSFFKLGIANVAPDLDHETRFSLLDFVRRMDETNYGHFVIYVVLFKFAVTISSPFFAVYMLKHLNFSYLQFTLLISCELIASFIAMGFWGRLIDKNGTKSVLYIGGIVTPFIPALWLFSGNPYYLAFVQIIAGAAWSGFNLSASNFIFDAVQPENRVRCIAYYKFFESMAIFLGALTGGFLISRLPLFFFSTTILSVFLISAILRLLASIFLLPKLKEARLVELGIGHSFFRRYLTIRPSEGLVFEVIGKYHKNDEHPNQKQRTTKQNPKSASEDKRDYNKKLLKFIGKGITPKKEQHSLTNMHEIEHIAEEIEKGKFKK